MVIIHRIKVPKENTWKTCRGKLLEGSDGQEGRRANKYGRRNDTGGMDLQETNADRGRHRRILSMVIKLRVVYDVRKMRERANMLQDSS